MTLAIELEHHKLSSDFYHATSQVSSYVSKSATLNSVPSGCARLTLKKQLLQMKMTWLCVAGSNLWAVSFGIAEYRVAWNLGKEDHEDQVCGRPVRHLLGH